MSRWERAIPIATFLFVVIGGIFFFGGEWRSMKDKIEWLVTENRDISTEVTAVRVRIEAIEQANARRRQGNAETTLHVETPQFDRGESVR